MAKETNKIGKFHFDINIPAEVLPAIKKVLLPLDWMLPGWAQHCFIHYCIDDEDGHTASADVSYEYRFIHVNLYPQWLTLDEEYRIETLVHELIHSMTMILFSYTEQTVQALTKDQELLKEAILEEMKNRHESMTQDLTWVIRGLMKQHG